MPNTGVLFLSASDLLERIKTVDGENSGLDADLVDGLQASQFLRNDLGSIELPMYINWGTPGRFVMQRIGNTLDRTPALLLFAKKPTDEALPKMGFDGYVFIHRGQENWLPFCEFYRTVCITCETRSFLYLHSNSINGYLVEVEYEGETWYGLYRETGWVSTVTIVGYLFGEPIFIPNASEYTVTKVDGSDLFVSRNKVWHEGNMGAESGLDADMVDGLHVSDLDARHALSDLTNVSDDIILDKLKNVDGSGSGLDADMVDGLHVSDLDERHALSDLTNVSDDIILDKLKNVDGSGSGLDADTLDGHDSGYFASASALSSHVNDYSNPHHVTTGQIGAANDDLSNVSDSVILNKIKNVDGSGSGLDADTLDGKHYSDINNTYVRKDGANLDGSLIPDLNAEQWNGLKVYVLNVGLITADIQPGSYYEQTIGLSGTPITSSNFVGYTICYKDSYDMDNGISINHTYMSDDNTLHIYVYNNMSGAVSFAFRPIIIFFYQ